MFLPNDLSSNLQSKKTVQQANNNNNNNETISNKWF